MISLVACHLSLFDINILQYKYLTGDKGLFNYHFLSLFALRTPVWSRQPYGLEPPIIWFGAAKPDVCAVQTVSLHVPYGQILSRIQP